MRNVPGSAALQFAMARLGSAAGLAIAFWPVWVTGAQDLAEHLKSVPYKIVYETYREDNWELFLVHADGSNPVNLTGTPGVNELCPHASPRGDRISFLVDEGEGASTVRSAYYMNLDGRQVVWGRGDWILRAVDLDLTGEEPKVSGGRDIVTSADPMMVYHADWSPDGKYLAFARGPRRKGMGLAPPYLGASAEGWEICVADATRENRWIAITGDGRWNKEPDWVPVRKEAP